jgi:hypothetical protein
MEKKTAMPKMAMNVKGQFNGFKKEIDIDIDEMEASLEEKEMELEAKRLQLENFKTQQAEAKRKENLVAIDAALENAKRYEEWAKSETSKVNSDKELIEQYLQMAREATNEAKALQMELGLETQVMPATEMSKGTWSLLHNWSWAISLLVTIFAVYFSYTGVLEYKDVIDAKNAAIDDPSLKIGNPYDESSMQGIIYDNLIQLTDIPKLWLFLLILMPPMFFYMLPFVKTKNSPWLDFQAAEPATRLWLLYGFSALVFLSSALSHLAGSSR